MDLGIKDRVAIVTGGSRGLGRQIALSLAREGVKVAICGRTQDSLEKTLAEIKTHKVKAIAIPADVTEPGAAQRIYDTTVEQLGPVDILVNNVGGSRGIGPDIESTPEEGFRQIFELNLFDAFRLIKLVVPGMRQRKWGRIISIASIYGREYGGSISYMAAKAALIAITKHLALTLAKDNVLINSVAPGSILFPGGGWDRFVREQPKEVVQEFIARNLPMGKFGWPEPIGDTVAFLASERASLITGACINVDGGQSRSLI